MGDSLYEDFDSVWSVIVICEVIMLVNVCVLCNLRVFDVCYRNEINVLIYDV